MRWLVIKVAWHWHEWKFYIRGLGRMSWHEFHVWYEWGLVIGIGRKFYAWWVFFHYLIMIGLWLVRNSLESLGEISGSCFSGRYVISWPLLVGIHGGALSI